MEEEDFMKVLKGRFVEIDLIYLDRSFKEIIEYDEFKQMKI